MACCMDEIIPGLYLGGITGVFDPSALRDRGLTHVLSLMDRPLPGELMSGFSYLHVFALDMYDHDLLQDLERCLKFVEEGRQHGTVLVHCQAGASRSATVVVAYIMRTCSMSRTAALEFVRARRSIVSPNEGFLQQLEVFELMGCRVNESHEEFRRYMLNKVAVRSKSGFCEDKLPSSIYRPESSPVTASDTVYKCCKCRRTLFLRAALIPHLKGQGESAFDWRSKVPANQRPSRQRGVFQEDSGIDENDDDNDDDGDNNVVKRERCEVSLFVEPMAWMKGQVETVEGKLACPKCRAKLGSFVWYGERCPCGAWVAPAFHIQNSKVDAKKPRIAPVPSLQAASAQPPSSQQAVSSVPAGPSATAADSGD